MSELKIFQVTGNWTVFRMPILHSGYDFDNMEDWLVENCVGTYKLFQIDHGTIGNSEYGHGDYTSLLEVDLLSDIDVMAFKLRWL